MDVIVRATTQDAVKLTARLMADELRKQPDMVFGLATGRTMEAVYAELARMHREEGLNFTHAKSFNLDEYIGLAGDDVNSYRYYMNKHLFNNINIRPENTFLPDGTAANPDREGRRYDEAINNAGGVTLQLLGIGRDGHIGFNEPGSSLRSRTRAVCLTPETYEQNSPLFARREDMPMRAFTMGVGTILESQKILMLVTGDEKAEILAAAVEGPLTAMVSGSAVQLHNDAVVIVDEAAGRLLKHRAYYDFSFQADPRWAAYR